MAEHREYLSDLPLRIPPIVRARAERALELGLIDPSHYLKAALSLEPVVDVIRDDDLRMRIAMILVLARRGDAEAVLLLKHLCRDPEDHVRTHAAQALEGIDRRRRDSVRSAQQQTEREPQSGRAWATLAGAHLSVAQLHDDAPVLCDFHLQQAATALEHALHQEPRVEWLVLQAELQQLGRQWGEAETTARLILEREPLHAQALLLLAGLAFVQGRYEQVRESCQRLGTLPELPEPVLDQVAFWTELVAGRLGGGAV